MAPMVTFFLRTWKLVLIQKISFAWLSAAGGAVDTAPSNASPNGWYFCGVGALQGGQSSQDQTGTLRAAKGMVLLGHMIRAVA